MNKELDKTKIPNGIYCHDDKGLCPYWKRVGKIHWSSSPKNEFELKCPWDCKEDTCDGCASSVVRCEYMDFTDFDEATLLWDAVKECGVNEGE